MRRVGQGNAERCRTRWLPGVRMTAGRSYIYPSLALSIPNARPAELDEGQQQDNEQDPAMAAAYPIWNMRFL